MCTWHVDAIPQPCLHTRRFGDVTDGWGKVSHVNCCSLEPGDLELMRITISVHLHGNLLLVFETEILALLARLASSNLSLAVPHRSIF